MEQLIQMSRYKSLSGSYCNMSKVSTAIFFTGATDIKNGISCFPNRSRGSYKRSLRNWAILKTSARSVTVNNFIRQVLRAARRWADRGAGAATREGGRTDAQTDGQTYVSRNPAETHSSSRLAESLNGLAENIQFPPEDLAGWDN